MLNHNRIPCGGGVDKVGLIEVRIGGDPFEEKGDQDRIVLFGHGGVNGGKFIGVLVAQIAGNLHPRDDDDRTIGGELFGKLVDIVASDIEIDPRVARRCRPFR